MTHGSAFPCEPRPRDFVARLPRRARGMAVRGAGSRRTAASRRTLVLLAAVAVPAFAAPEDWGGFHIGNAGSATLQLEPMPFEKPGDSFPGSAFYYLASDDQQQYWAPGSNQPLVPGIHSDAEDAPAGPGPAARALRIDNSGLDRSRALQCLTAAIYYEARSEPDAGQRAVAQVVLNRVAHPSYPNTVCGVVYQGSERTTGCQFSFTCDGSLARKPAPLFWQRAEDVARAALSGYVYSPVGLATHYHTIAVHPYWAPSLAYLGTIGAHRFYRFQGAAGSAGAFRFAYAGGEPQAVPHARSAVLDAAGAAALDPLAIQRAYDAGLRSTPGPAPTALSASRLAPSPALAPAPAYAHDVQQRGGETLYRGQNLPDATGVKAEYANSGKWIERPGT